MGKCLKVSLRENGARLTWMNRWPQDGSAHDMGGAWRLVSTGRWVGSLKSKEDARAAFRGGQSLGEDGRGFTG